MTYEFKAFGGSAIGRSCASCKWLEQCPTPAASEADSKALQQTFRSVRARQIVCRSQDLHDAVPVICDGWAASIRISSNGSRQILSFLLPGDIVSTALVFAPPQHQLIEAITDVCYCTFQRDLLKTMLLEHAGSFDRLAKAWMEEKDRSDRLIVDLGRRSADERIARLIMNLYERVMQRCNTGAGTKEMDFPLRQHHIADATGLTAVHVSKVLSGFKRKALIKISDRSLTISDPAGLRPWHICRNTLRFIESGFVEIVVVDHAVGSNRSIASQERHITQDAKSSAAYGRAPISENLALFLQCWASLTRILPGIGPTDESLPVPCKSTFGDMQEGYYCPSLTDLIEACGTQFGRLYVRSRSGPRKEKTAESKDRGKQRPRRVRVGRVSGGDGRQSGFHCTGHWRQK